MLQAIPYQKFSEVKKDGKRERFCTCRACGSKTPLSVKPTTAFVCEACESTIGPVKINGQEFILPQLDHFHLPIFLGLEHEKQWQITGLKDWKDVTITSLEEEEEDEPLRIFDGSCDACQAIFSSGMVKSCKTCCAKRGKDFHFCLTCAHDKRHVTEEIENVFTGLEQYHGTDGTEVTGPFFPSNFNEMVRGLLLYLISDPAMIFVRRKGDLMQVDLDRLPECDKNQVFYAVKTVLADWNDKYFGHYDKVDDLIDYLDSCHDLKEALAFTDVPMKQFFPYEEKMRICDMLTTTDLWQRVYLDFFRIPIPESDEISLDLNTLTDDQWVALSACIKTWEEKKEKSLAAKKPITIVKKRGRPAAEKKKTKSQKLIDMKEIDLNNDEDHAKLLGLMTDYQKRLKSEEARLIDMEKVCNNKVTNAQMELKTDVFDQYRLIDPKEECEKLWAAMENDDIQDIMGLDF